jgi:hypothetical protein
VVLDALCRLGSQEVAGRRLEKREYSSVLEGGRVGDVYDHRRSREHFGDSFAGDGIDTGIR